jgi:electron transport complex protein RnfG
MTRDRSRHDTDQASGDPAPGEVPLERLDRRPPLHAALSLTLLAAVAAALVGTAWLLTRSPIAANESRQALERLRAVLPPGLYDNDPLRDTALLPVDGPGRPLRPVHRARRTGVPVAAVLTTESRDGYGGPIRLLVGVAADGSVLGVRATAHNETPGIGDFVTGRGPDGEWLGIFRGRSGRDPELPRWTLRRDGGEFDAVAGATITSRSVVAGVHNAVQYFERHRDDIFSAPAVPAARTPEAP